MKGLYVASRCRHARRWLALRAAGWPVAATWIDEAGEGESASLAELWVRCVREASGARALLLYVEEGEQLKGALVEVGAALAAGVPVFVAGAVEASWKHHPLVRCFATFDLALAGLAPLFGGPPP